MVVATVVVVVTLELVGDARVEPGAVPARVSDPTDSSRAQPAAGTPATTRSAMAAAAHEPVVPTRTCMRLLRAVSAPPAGPGTHCTARTDRIVAGRRARI